MEIDVLDPHAHIIGTSKNQSMVGGRLIRDEITRALTGELSETIRYDPASEERRYYLAFPLKDEGGVNGIIYLSGSLNNVDTVLNQIKLIMLSGSDFALAVSFLLGIILAKTISTPIQEVTRQAGLMAQGDFSQKINVKSADEIGRLGATFNHLAEQLDRNIQEISSGKSKVEAMINHMSDGVIALDGKGRLIHINPAAQGFLKKLVEKIPGPGCSGFPLLDKLIGAEPLRQFMHERKPLTLEISRENPAVALKITLAPFKEEEGGADGTLMVLHDVTVERELVRRQQEFVADVSHELRTPLTAVKSYVETLLDGAAADPAVCHRFLNVLKRKPIGWSIWSDLLVLSQLDYSQVELHKTKVELVELVNDAMEQLQQKAGSRLSEIELAIHRRFPRCGWTGRRSCVFFKSTK